MRAKLSGYLFVVDCMPQDLTVWQPDDPEDFDIQFDFHACPADEDWAAAFAVRVCSPKGFFRDNAGKVLSGTHVLFMERFDGARLLRHIEEACAQIEGETWEELALQLNQIGDWEFLYRAVLTPELPTPYQDLLARKYAQQPISLWQFIRSKIP